MNNELENGKDKLVGKVKETTGKVTGNEELELKGKLQAMKADIGNKMEDMKEDVLEKVNDFIDKVKEHKRDKE